MTTEEIDSTEKLEEWLKNKPYTVSRALLLRAYLRVLPIVFGIYQQRDNRISGDLKQKSLLNIFRSIFVSSTIFQHDLVSQKAAASSHQAALRIANSQNSVWERHFMSFTQMSHVSQQVSFAYSLTDPSSHRIAQLAGNAVGMIAASVFSLATEVLANPSSELAPPKLNIDQTYPELVWASVRSDCAYFENGSYQSLVNEPLWLDDVRGTQTYNTNIPIEMRAHLDRFRKTDEYKKNHWGMWLDWYSAVVRGEGSFFGQEADIEIATKPDEFWDRDIALVMDDLVEITGWKEGGSSNNGGPTLPPIPDLPKTKPPSTDYPDSWAPYSYEWTSEHKIALDGDALDAILVPEPRSPDDAKNRLEAAKKAASDLLGDLSTNGFQVPEAYKRSLERYVEALPGSADGAIYVADQEMRTLRDDLEDDLKQGINTRFANRLKRIIEQHYGLRPYYPDLLNFYDDVKAGELVEPPPLEAFEKLDDTIRDNTPDVFDDSVQRSLNRLDVPDDRPEKYESPVQSPTTDEAIEATDLPVDPIKDIDPERARQNAKAGALQKIGKTLDTAEKGAKNIERVKKVAKTFKETGRPIWDFIRSLGENGGDVPPGLG